MIMMIMANSYRVKILLFDLLPERFPFSLTTTRLEALLFGDCNSSSTFLVDGGISLLDSSKPFLLSLPSKTWICFNFWPSDFIIYFLPCLCHLLSTPSFFNWSLQDLAIFYSTPKLPLVTSVMWMTHLTLRPFRSLISTSHDLMSNIPFWLPIPQSYLWSSSPKSWF